MKKYFMPVGNTDFGEIRKSGLYYIDKTMLIDQLVDKNKAKVTLFTRPRRFGKTLNMSMLEHFFDIRRDSRAIFEGLEISENTALCSEWMNQYPTIFISFKDVGGLNFLSAFKHIQSVISKLYEKHDYLLQNNPHLTKMQEKMFDRLLMRESDQIGVTESLFLLTNLMYDYYGKPVIILIDEYDVPMAKGSVGKYYDEIIDIMRYMLSKALKDNPYLKFAALTGCLRIAKESIFTGLNNLYVDTISGNKYNEFFGFTEKEVDKLLSDTELTPYKFIVKDWYDGYRFGQKEIYCPWDVLNYVSELQDTPGIAPKDYWSNTSSNDIIRQYLESNLSLNEQMEILIRGESIEVELNDSVTYRDLTSTEANFWSVLYSTGYLTTVEEKPENILETYSSDASYIQTYRLKLVNKEIRILFVKTIAAWFKENIVKDERTELINSLWAGDAEKLGKIISKYLASTISYYDYSENFYHAFTAGLFSAIRYYAVKSNYETGNGRSDIIIKNNPNLRAAILELKIAKNIADIPVKCDEALQQIKDRNYAQPLIDEEGLDVISYGVTFYKKKCFIKKG